MANINNYYLNLDKINTLTEDKQKPIYDLYRDMIFNYAEKRPMIGDSFFNTLFHSGYLVDIRQQKIEEILDDNSISS